MKRFIYQLDPDDIPKGMGDELAQQLLRVWRQSEGYLTDAFEPMLLSTIMLNQPDPVCDSPDILFCGPEALATKIMGEDWAEIPSCARSAFEDRYRSLVGNSYHEAHRDNTPQFDLISTPFTAGERSIDLKYERLILPVTTLAGANFLFCYSFSSRVDPGAKGLLSSGGSRSCRPTQSICPQDLFAQAASPI